MQATPKSPSTTQTKKVRQAPKGRRNRNVRLAPITARDLYVELGTRAVESPSDATCVETVPVNRRVDILAAERSAGSISEAAFLVGRMIQTVFERGSGARLGSGGWTQGGSRDQTIAHELAIILSVEDAQRLVKFTARLERAIGVVGTRFLRAMLTEGHSFSTYAAARGRANKRGVNSFAERFRWLLESLVEAQHTAHGPDRAPIKGERYES